METMLEATVIGQDWADMDTEAHKLVAQFFDEGAGPPNYTLRDIHPLIVGVDGLVTSWEGTVVVDFEAFNAWVFGP